MEPLSVDFTVSKTPPNSDPCPMHGTPLEGLSPPEAINCHLSFAAIRAHRLQTSSLPRRVCSWLLHRKEFTLDCLHPPLKWIHQTAPGTPAPLLTAFSFVPVFHLILIVKS